jgi:hypothetical protein
MIFPVREVWDVILAQLDSKVFAAVRIEAFPFLNCVKINMILGFSPLAFKTVPNVWRSETYANRYAWLVSPIFFDGHLLKG